MATQTFVARREQLLQETRQHFVTDASRALEELAGLVQDRLSQLMREAVPSREMQDRRDAWTAYQRERAAWVNATQQDWKEALQPAAPKPRKKIEGALELVATDVADNKILASRLALGVLEKAGAEYNDLLFRVNKLQGTQELDDNDILRPEAILLLMVGRWVSVGLQREAWQLVNEVAQKLLTERLKQAYANGNAFLIKQGVSPTIEFSDRISRKPAAAVRSGAPASAEEPSASPGASKAGPQEQSGTADARRGQYLAPREDSGVASASEETRMRTAIAPAARARNPALGVMGQLKSLLASAGGLHFDSKVPRTLSPALATAMAVRTTVRPVGSLDSSDIADAATILEDYSPAAVLRASADLRRRTTDLKDKAESKDEKAVIEIVALMFQAILQEDRIPPGIRVWFARLQMPVLRVALAEPDFFGTLDHPARQLIDRMGSCVMGFDASVINGSALETEVKRIVQVIEQYPETGKRVYQLVYDEFQKFLAQFLTGRSSTQKVVSVAQQVEQKQILTIRYTIEVRNMLKDLPVREEIRQFLFKVWAEVLAVAAVRKGPQHEETLALKKLASDLVWAASAKPNRSDRARVIRDLPLLLQKLRTGMTLLGLTQADQDAYVKTVSNTLADAFVSKTQAIPSEQIAAMAERLAHLEDFVSDDGAGDLPLDAQSIEVMLGLDASNIDVVTDGGAKPTTSMLAWAKQLQVGSWFTLDHNGHESQVQFVWRSEHKHLNLFASSDGRSYLVQAGRLAAYLQAGLLLPQEQEALTVRATRDALTKLSANPERLLG